MNEDDEEPCDVCGAVLRTGPWKNADIVVDVEGCMARHLDCKSMYVCPDTNAMREADGVCATDSCFSLFCTRDLPGGAEEYAASAWCYGNCACREEDWRTLGQCTLLSIVRRHWEGLEHVADATLEQCMGVGDCTVTIVYSDGGDITAVGKTGKDASEHIIVHSVNSG